MVVDQNYTYQNHTYQNRTNQNYTYQNHTYQNRTYQNYAYQNHTDHRSVPPVSLIRITLTRTSCCVSQEHHAIPIHWRHCL